MSGLEREALAKFAAFMDSSITYGNVENWWRDNGPKVRQILRNPASGTGHVREAPPVAEDTELHQTREALKDARDRIKAALDAWNDDYGDEEEQAYVMRRILLEGQLVLDLDRKIMEDNDVFLMVEKQPHEHTPLTIEANPPKGVSPLRARWAVDRLLADGRLVLDDDLSFLRTYGQPPSKRIANQGDRSIEKEEAVHALVVASQNIERVLVFLTRDD